MQQRGLGWKKLGTHEKHLSVYNYEKKMRKQEVEELERRLQDKADTMELQETMYGIKLGTVEYTEKVSGRIRAILQTMGG